MTSGPRELAYRVSNQGVPLKVVLPVSEARRKAREIISQHADGALLAVVENWQQRPDGQIEFTVRALVAPD